MTVFIQKVLELESWKLVYIWMMSYYMYITGLIIRLIAVIIPFISIFFSFQGKFVSRIIFSGPVKGITFHFCKRMKNEGLYPMIETQAHCSYSSLFWPVFVLSLFCMFTLNNCVRVFSGLLELKSCNLVFIGMISCGMV